MCHSSGVVDLPFRRNGICKVWDTVRNLSNDLRYSPQEGRHEGSIDNTLRDYDN